MKKLICILLSLILAMGILTGCDAGATNEAEETPKESGSQTQAESLKENEGESSGDTEVEEKIWKHPYHNIDSFTDEERAEIESAWLDAENNGIEIKDDSHLYIDRNPIHWYDPNERDNDKSTRYYGEIRKYNDKGEYTAYHVMYVYVGTRALDGAEHNDIAGFLIYSMPRFEILVYNGGKFITLNEAYEDGIVDNTLLGQIFAVHYSYEDQILQKWLPGYTDTVDKYNIWYLLTYLN